jgi:catechol 2,3-dioxygenase-like lactoylglutathione lyase family enzyme
MLADKDAMPTLGVKDLNVAREFYEGKLGLEPRPGNQEAEVLQFMSGNTKIIVYRSQYAGTNQATAATWNVGGEVEEVVKTLKGRGVVFEHYDMPGLTLEGDLHVHGNFKVAWLKDPDGNILQILGGAA